MVRRREAGGDPGVATARSSRRARCRNRRGGWATISRGSYAGDAARRSIPSTSTPPASARWRRRAPRPARPPRSRFPAGSGKRSRFAESSTTPSPGRAGCCSGGCSRPHPDRPDAADAPRRERDRHARLALADPASRRPRARRARAERAARHRRRGRALRDAAPYARMPEDMPDRLALAVLDVAGAAPQVARLVKPGASVCIFGAGGKSGMLCAAEARRTGGKTARVIGIESHAPFADDLRALGLCDEVLVARCARSGRGARPRCSRRTAAARSTSSLSCVNVTDAEMSAILVTRDRGIAYFFAMSTSFTKAALGAEGVGKDVDLMIGNGFAHGHADHSLAMMRRSRRSARCSRSATGDRRAAQLRAILARRSAAAPPEHAPRDEQRRRQQRHGRHPHGPRGGGDDAEHGTGRGEEDARGAMRSGRGAHGELVRGSRRDVDGAAIVADAHRIAPGQSVALLPSRQRSCTGSTPARSIHSGRPERTTIAARGEARMPDVSSVRSAVARAATDCSAPSPVRSAPTPRAKQSSCHRGADRETVASGPRRACKSMHTRPRNEARPCTLAARPRLWNPRSK